MSNTVTKYILENGLTVLVKNSNNIPKVSVQLWYHVGSKDERSDQRGFAHFIEHMIFKGTSILSECDIDAIVSKLSGSCNAFTAFDHTGYIFDFPSQNWHEALPIMADCMKNCSFNQEHINSELKAVVQELKLGKDKYLNSLIKTMMPAIFIDHPYNHPVLGYKHDLLNITKDALVNFYKQHYIPNNATLVVVGDAHPKIVLELAKKYLESIEPNFDYKKQKFHHTEDLKTINLTLYRDIKQPLLILNWVVPGLKQKEEYLISIASYILGSGRGSRLYKQLIDIHQLATEINSFHWSLFDYGMFFIYIRPKDIKDTNKIIDIVNQEIADIIKNGFKPSELVRSSKKFEVDHLSILENNEHQATLIGQYYLAISDENYLYNSSNYADQDLPAKMQKFFSTYFLTNLMNQGQILPFDKEGRGAWLKLQEMADDEDHKILSNIKRTTPLDKPRCALSVKAHPPLPFNYPRAEIKQLPNDLKLLYFNNNNLPKIDLFVDFKAKYYYDPQDLQGLNLFTTSLLEEGTKNYSSQQLADTLEESGMNLKIESGRLTLSLLSKDLIKGLELINELLTGASFKPADIERVREQRFADLNEFWDNPLNFVKQLIKDEIYKNHPYSKNLLGTFESIKKINRTDLVDYYKHYLSPVGTHLSLAGNLSDYDLPGLAGRIFENWNGTLIQDISYPKLQQISYREINYPIIRDQIVLAYGGISTNRTNPDYDKLLIFDQIFTGGVLGTMSSKLFKLREESGLFYTINGSLVLDVNTQPGLIMIKTIVSKERLLEAERVIENVICTAIDGVTETEFHQAKLAIINSLVDNYSSNLATAATFLFKDYYNFPSAYFDNRARQILSVSLEEMIKVVKKYLDINKMIKVRVGRI